MEIGALAGAVVVRVQADTEPLEKGLNDARQKTDGFWRDQNGRLRDVQGRYVAAGGAAKKFGDEVAGSAGRASAANDNVAGSARRASAGMEGMVGSAHRLAAALGAIAGALAVRAITGYADAWSDMQSRVGAAIRDMDAAPALMKRIVDIANASYSPLEQTVEVYSRNVAVLRDLGRSATEAADFTEALNHALVITATRGERAASVQNALSKAMAVGKLQADGLETVLANGGEVAQALADELGTNVNGLRHMATQGKITGDVIANALITRLDDLRDRAGEMPATIGDAFVRIQTNLTAFIGQMDKAAGVSETVATALMKFADNIDRVITYGAAAVTMFGTYYVAAMVAAKASTVTLTGALTLLRTALIRTGIGALVVGAGELVYQFGRLVEATGSWGAALQEVGRRAEFLLDAVVWGFRTVGDAISSIWAGAMADILRTTESTFGEILRWFGVSAESMSTAIANMEKRAENMGEAAKLSASIAAGQFERAFAPLDTASESADDAAGSVKRLASALDDGGKAAKRAAQELEQFKRRADALAEEMFPGEYARREAEELLALLDRFGDKLDDFQRKAVEHRIDLMFASSAAGVRDLSQETQKAGKEMEKAFQPVADLFADLFSKPIKDLDELVDRAMSAFAQIGQANLKLFTDQLFGTGAANDNMPELAGRVGRAMGKAAAPELAGASASGTFAGIFQALGMSQSGSQKAGGMLGAGLGGLGMGYESQNPLMGALGGAMSGFMAGGPIGAVIGGVAGLIGGLLGKSKQKKEELERAQQELEQQMGAITQLIATATGNFMGQFEQSLVGTHDEFTKAIALAQKAGNAKLVRELKDAQTEFFDNMAEMWSRGFEGMLGSLNAGLGLDGEFMSGMDAVEKMRESLVGFVNDTKMFAEANGNLAKYVKGLLGTGSAPTSILTPRSGGVNGLNTYQKEYETGFGDSVMTVVNEFVSGYVDLGKQMVEMGVAAFDRNGGQLYDTLEELKRVAFDASLAIDEQGRVTKVAAAANDNLADSVRRAQDAAVASALAMITGAKEFTEMEKAVQRMEGAAASLPSLLEDLGRSAEEAAAAIEQSLIVAMDKLRMSMETDLLRSINDLSDMGFMNDLLDAQTMLLTRIRDAHASGADVSLVFTELGLRLRQIAGDAELTDDQLRQLAGVFPMLGGELMGLIGLSAGNTSAAVSAAKAALDEAKADLRSAYEEEKRLLEQVVSRHEALIKSLQRFRDDLRLDTSLSPLDPYQRMLEAQKQFQETAALALTGDEDALGRLEDVSRAYLTEARSYYATSAAYYSIFTEVESILDQALALAGNQLSEAERQLAALDAQVSELMTLNDTALTVVDAINALAEAEAAHAAAQAAHTAAQDQRISDMMNLVAQMQDQQKREADYYVSPEVEKIYQEIVGRFPEKDGADYWQRVFDSGMAVDEIYRRFINDVIALGATPNPAAVAQYGIGDVGTIGMGFASGGYTGMLPTNAVAGVVHGQEFVAHAEATRRWRPQLEAMNAGTYRGGGQDNAALIAEIRALRQQVAELERSNAQVTVAAAQEQVAATEGTTQAVNKQATSQWQSSRARRTA